MVWEECLEARIVEQADGFLDLRNHEMNTTVCFLSHSSCQTVDPSPLRRRVIIAPSANLPATMTGRKISPIDGGNPNRRPPGSEGDSPTEMVANFVEIERLPMSDCAIEARSHPGEAMTCPECNHEKVPTRWRVENVLIVENGETMRVLVPVRECVLCGSEWTEHDADVVRGRAIEQYCKEE